MSESDQGVRLVPVDAGQIEQLHNLWDYEAARSIVEAWRTTAIGESEAAAIAELLEQGSPSHLRAAQGLRNAFGTANP